MPGSGASSLQDVRSECMQLQPRIYAASSGTPQLTDAEAASLGPPGKSGREVVPTPLTNRTTTLRGGLFGQKADHHDVMTSGAF